MKIIRKARDNIYFQLFTTFFVLGVTTFGGGMAMLPQMHRLMTEKKKWMTDEEVVDCLALSQALPGVIAVNMATYVGRFKKGISGAICATVGVILPSFIIIILVVELLKGIGDNAHVSGALAGVKAATTGLIGYSAFMVGRRILNSVFPWILGIISFVVVTVFGVSAALTILLSIVIGITYYVIRKKFVTMDTVDKGDTR